MCTPPQNPTWRNLTVDGVTAVANVLKMEGVEWIGVMPSNPLIEAAAIAGIRPVVCRQERTGVHMADGFSRVMNGKKTGIFLAQNGPGAENAFGGVAQAYADSVPILVLPAGVARNRIGVEPNFHPVRAYESITKWAAHVNFADRVPELMRQAFTKLRSGKPGPVLLEIPSDLSSDQISEEDFDYIPPQPMRVAADPAAVTRAARGFLSAQRPVIMAGQGVLYAEATDELLELAEFLQIPVLTTLEGKSAFPENHPLSLGIGGSSQTGPVHRFLSNCDVIFGAGVSFTKSSFTVPIPSGKTLIHLTNGEGDINKDHRTEYPILGDAKLALRQFIDELKAQGAQQRAPNQELAGEIAASREAWLAEWMPRLTSDEVPLNPYRVVWDIMHTVDLDNTIVTHESGSPREQVSPFWEARAPRSFIGWGKSTQLGYSLGLAMGAKMAAPEKTVINFMGDAAFGMVGLDVETAVRANIPITTVVMNNSTMAIYPDSRIPTAVERYGLKDLSGDFYQVALALGAYAEQIHTPEEIKPAMQRAMQANADGRPALLEFITKEEGTFSKFRFD
ncbi:MAG: thiamine pyrophosphate-requiring protein [Chloroflexi bacterium]|nr:thiamine pyrophosphate-requiring protein [Chloroflexota bacterium]MYD49506.1 thiamine pyrophosphate-requiring protein [Chloroflexota bacterium]